VIDEHVSIFTERHCSWAGFLIILGLFRSFAAVGLDDQAENRGVHLVGRPTGAAGCRARRQVLPITLRKENQPVQSPLVVLLNHLIFFKE
jgi:hypothetical protein